MMTDIDIEDALYDYLKDSELTQEVRGELYKGERKDGSRAEDVVIVVTSNINSDDIQTGSVNVNIYVPKVPTASGEIQDKPRVRDLARIAEALLKVINADGYRMALDRQRVFEMPSNREHCISNMLNVQYYNQQDV